MSSRVSGEDCAYTVQRLQRVDMFLQRAVPTQPSDENSSLHALKLFVCKYFFCLLHCSYQWPTLSIERLGLYGNKDSPSVREGTFPQNWVLSIYISLPASA